MTGGELMTLSSREIRFFTYGGENTCELWLSSARVQMEYANRSRRTC